MVLIDPMINACERVLAVRQSMCRNTLSTKIRYFGTVLVTFTLLGCVPKKLGNGEEHLQAFDVAPFTQIEVSGEWTLTVEHGPVQRVEVKTDKNLMEFIRCDVVDGRLKLSTSEAINPRAGLEVKIRMTSLTSFAAAGKVEAQLILDPDGGTLKAAGLTRISARAVGGSLSIKTVGASRITLEGQANDLSIDSEGASRIVARKLIVPKVTLSAVGASRVNIGATESLKITGRGAATIEHAASKQLTIDTSDSVRVRQSAP